MGNCLVGAMGDGDLSVIRVATSHGGVMEFKAPVTVESITDEFPGHGIFRGQDLFWKPLPHSELLIAGESYHLLPLLDDDDDEDKGGPKAPAGHARSLSAPPHASQYRMSFDSRGLSKRSPEEESPAPGGFWKVKLVITPEQLLEIFAEEGKTQELIESVRTVAKCGSGLSASAFSDQWSLSGSRNAIAESEMELENRKYELLRDVMDDTQRGLIATPDQRSAIEEALVNVESFGAGKPTDLSLLDDTWRLQNTSAHDVLISSSLPLLFLSLRLTKFFKNLIAKMN